MTNLISSLLPTPSLSAPAGQVPADDLLQIIKDGITKRGDEAWLDDVATAYDAYNFSDPCEAQTPCFSYGGKQATLHQLAFWKLNKYVVSMTFNETNLTRAARTCAQQGA